MKGIAWSSEDYWREKTTIYRLPVKFTVIAVAGGSLEITRGYTPCVPKERSQSSHTWAPPRRSVFQAEPCPIPKFMNFLCCHPLTERRPPVWRHLELCSRLLLPAEYGIWFMLQQWPVNPWKYKILSKKDQNIGQSTISLSYLPSMFVQVANSFDLPSRKNGRTNE